MALDLSVGLDVIFSDLGQAATYTPRGGSASAVSVIVDRGDQAIDLGVGVGLRAARRRLWVRVSEVATAGSGDVVVVGGETLTANAAHRDEGGGVWSVECRP